MLYDVEDKAFGKQAFFGGKHYLSFIL